MGDQASYYRRLRVLLDAGRSTGITHVAGGLVPKLEADFTGDKKLFSESEYRDPSFRKAVLQMLFQRGTVSYFVSELTALLTRMLGSGTILNLYSNMGEFLFEFCGGIGVEPNPLTARWSQFLLAIGGVDAKIINEDPTRWKSEQAFARIICNTPFGFKQDQTRLLATLFSLLSSSGNIVLFAPPDFLNVAKYKWYREYLLSHGQIRAIISLPPKLCARPSIQTTIVLIARGVTGNVYMAASKTPADLSAIGEDYTAWQVGRAISVGFETVLNLERWDIPHYEPIDFGLGTVTFPYQVVRLGDLASVRTGVLSPESKLAVNRTGSKVFWLDSETDLIEESSIFVEPKPSVNPMYLYLYLSSSLGKQALSRCIEGATIPHVSAKAMQLLPVVLPDLSKQAQIVAQALEIKKTTGTLEALVAEGKQSLSDNFFELEMARNKFRAFSTQTDKSFYQTLPFPIAIVYRKVANAENNTQRFSLLIELFEVVIRFVVLVQVADHLSSLQKAEVLTKIPDLSKLDKPSLGIWVSLFRSLSQFQTDSSFLKEIRMLKVTEYRRTMDELVRLRNESFKGHGATLTEGEYEVKFQEYAPSIYELVGKLGFLASYRLVKAGSMKKDGDYFRISTQVLMGDNPVFETQVISSRTPVDADKVLYLNASLDPLVLDPFVILETCTECHRPELLLLDKFSGKKITYLGYESGHKPSYANIDKLPLVLREAALGQL